MQKRRNAAFRGKLAFCSNFYSANIIFEDISYPTAEHAFAAAKTLNLEERKRIASLPTPGEAKKAGRQVALRPDWEEVKIDIMTRIVRDKFFRNKQLGQKLLETGDMELIEENWWGDDFWGVCTKKGQNNLGKILMQIRQELRIRKKLCSRK